MVVGLRGLVLLMEARDVATGSEGLSQPGSVDAGDGFRGARLARGPPMKVRVLGGWAGPGQGLSTKTKGSD